MVGIKMNEEVIRNFASSYFTGLKDVRFGVMGDKRMMSLIFSDNDSYMDAIVKLRKGNILGIFIQDEENCVLNCDRDHFETAMYMTASQMAINGWLAEFSRKVEVEREAEEFLKKEKEKR